MTDLLLALLDDARHAPSVLNTQPWQFRLDGDAVLVLADRSRQLPALDPDGRELTISCGAALAVLRVAARHRGLVARFDLLPDGDDADLLARVTFEPLAAPDDDRLYRAIRLRRTHRRAFAGAPLPPDVAADLAAAASTDGAWLHLLTSGSDRAAIAAVTEEAVEAQAQNPDVVADIRAWLRPDGDPRPDGVRDGDQGDGDRLATVRTSAAAVAAHKAALLRAAPAVAILGTDGDTPRQWLAAGIGLGTLLLVAADRGLAVSYANEAVEMGGPYRRRVAALVGGGTPQIVIRVGQPADETGTPRRPLRDVARVPPEASAPTGAEPLRVDSASEDLIPL